MSDRGSVRDLLHESGHWNSTLSDSERQRGISRREFLKKTGLGLLSLSATGSLLSACGTEKAKRAPPVKTGYLPITDAAPLLTAHAKNFYQQEGLEAEEPTLIRGWASLAEAFMSGSVNVAHFLMPMTVWMRFAQNAPLKVVAWDHVDGSALTVQKDITNWKQLGGRTVAVPFWYSIHNVILQMGLKEHGLSIQTLSPNQSIPNDTVNLVVMPPPDMPAALGNDSIAGYIVAEPFNAIGELEVKANILRFTGDVWKRHACCVVTMHEELLNNQPDWARSVLRSIVKSQLWIRNNRKQAARLLSKEKTGNLPFSFKAIDRAMNFYDLDTYGPTGAIKHPEWGSERIDFYPYPYPSYTRELIRHMRDTEVEGDEEFLQNLTPEEAATDLVTYKPVRDAMNDVAGPSKFGVKPDRGYERKEIIDV